MESELRKLKYKLKYKLKPKFKLSPGGEIPNDEGASGLKLLPDLIFDRAGKFKFFGKMIVGFLLGFIELNSIDIGNKFN